MAEVDSLRVAAVFAADTQLDVWSGLSAQGTCHAYQLADTLFVDYLERIFRQDFLVHIGLEQFTGAYYPLVIAAGNALILYFIIRVMYRYKLVGTYIK